MVRSWATSVRRARAHAMCLGATTRTFAAATAAITAFVAGQ